MSTTPTPGARILRPGDPGPDTLSLLTAVELCHAGGALGRARPGNGALAAVDGEFVLSTAARSPTPAAAGRVAFGAEAVTSAMRPWSAKEMYLNIAGITCGPAGFWPAPAYARLRSVKAAVDPGNLIRSTHPIPPAAPGEETTAPEHPANTLGEPGRPPASSGKA